MDRAAVTQLFKTSNRLIRKKFFLASAVLLVLIFPTLVTHVFLFKLERRLDLKIYRKPLFTLVPGSIHIEKVSLAWRDHLSVSSGSVEVRYPVSAILKKDFPISLKGKGLAIEFGPELKQMVGEDRVVFDHVSAKLVIGSKHAKRKVEINQLDAESKTIQFHLNEKPAVKTG